MTHDDSLQLQLPTLCFPGYFHYFSTCLLSCYPSTKPTYPPTRYLGRVELEELAPLLASLRSLLSLGLQAHPTFKKCEAAKLHFTGRLETAEYRCNLAHKTWLTVRSSSLATC